MVYNAILRRWPENVYKPFEEENNLFPTTIAVLVFLSGCMFTARNSCIGLWPRDGHTVFCSQLAKAVMVYIDKDVTTTVALYNDDYLNVVNQM